MKEKFKTYQELLSNARNENRRLSYGELLLTTEWKERRKPILERDGNKCTSCQKEPTIFENGKPIRYYSEAELVQKRLEAKKEEERIYQEWLKSETRRRLLEIDPDHDYDYRQRVVVGIG